MMPLFPPNGVINLGTSSFGGTRLYVYILAFRHLLGMRAREQAPVEENILIFRNLLGE